MYEDPARILAMVHFGHVNRGFITEALTEAGRPCIRGRPKPGKTELAALAGREIRGTVWLPGPPRRKADMGSAESAAVRHDSRRGPVISSGRDRPHRHGPAGVVLSPSPLRQLLSPLRER
jgi:hypothetical protein